MLPAVWPGDVVTVRHCGLAEFQPGQIVLYRREGRLTLHRIARIVGDQVIARGDSLSSYDPAVRDDEIVGKAVSILRRGKAIDPEQSSLQRVVSWILRHSEFCALLLLRVGGRLQRAESGCESVAALPTVVK